MLFEFLKNYQVDIMLALASICAIIAFFTCISNIMSKRRKAILLMMQIGASIWLEADRISYLYVHGLGRTSFYLSRISNFFVYMMTVFVLSTVSLYLDDILRNEGGLQKTALGLKISNYLGIIAMLLVIISQFTGLYYTIDENNYYHRSKLFFICYVFPYIIMMLQVYVLAVYRKRLNGRLANSVLLFDIVCILASLIQFFCYGISLVDIAAVSMVVGLYVFALIDMNERVERAKQIELDSLRGEHENLRRLFEKTAAALVTAIDAKDEFTKDHSLRVAEYSKEIARLAGMTPKECDEAYFAGLMHDVGKIGIPDEIIRKGYDRTAEETEIFKKHAGIGGDILSNIYEFPSLYVGAKYHHERFDGKGYPEGLSGEGIPVLARIVSVADTYDSMTSRNARREPMPQSTVREEIIKRAGSSLDPNFCVIMVNMIDHDTEYMMREKGNFLESRKSDDLIAAGEMYFAEYKEHVSEGIRITEEKMEIQMDCQAEVGFDEELSIPAMILFDSHDACVHSDDREIRILQYIEYGEIWLDGHTIDTAARDIRVEEFPSAQAAHERSEGVTHYVIEASRYRDHARIKLDNGKKLFDITVALLDSIHYCYISFSGEHCHIMNVELKKTGETIDENYITRIVPEITYTDRIEGDLPNVQIDGYRKAYSKAVPVVDGMRVKLRTMSLPTANLIWHCAYVLLFSSDDELPEGEGYIEHCCMRFDGENATNNDFAENEFNVRRGKEFPGWDEWKKINKKGFECTVSFTRRRNKIYMETRNVGIYTRTVTTIPVGSENVYMALTGDQCVITDIRVYTGE